MRTATASLALALLLAAVALPAAAQQVDGQDLPARGDLATAQVEILEISDFQCPFCSRAQPTMKQIAETWPGRVRFVYLHLPLSFHKNARPAAIATVAAQRQGKFWEMHDKVFENQKALAEGDLRRYAKELGLDMRRFDKDLKDKKIGAWVDQQALTAGAVGVRGTPNFFVNGKGLRGAQPFPKFEELVKAELEAAEKEDAAGEAWITKRVKANNKTLHEYLRGGKVAKPGDTNTGTSAPKPVADETVWRVRVSPEDPSLGGSKKGALVTLVVFSDFQCPFCKRLAPVLDDLHKKYKKDLRIVFKQLPLSFHKRARPAAEAVLCAHDQGKFWPMHDLLFENQKQLEDEDLERWATEAGVKKMKKWRACYADKSFAAQVDADVLLAGEVTARGTPNSFVNGRKVTGARPLDDFVKIVDEELEKARAKVKEGIKQKDLYEHLIEQGKVFSPLDDTVHAFDTSKSPKLGPPDAAIQIAVFNDFECPFCARLVDKLEDVKRHYGDNLTLVFKHFPLSFHKNARPAALAAMCAHEQGAFWAFHDELFASQRNLGINLFERIAEDYGLDMGAFSRCMAEDSWASVIDADMADGRNIEVRGTPTVFINGRRYQPSGGYDLESMRKIIDAEILKGKKLEERPASGLDPLLARRQFNEAREKERTDVRLSIELYQKAANNGYPKAWKRLGLLLIQQGDERRAGEALRTYLAQLPHAADADEVNKVLGRIDAD